MFGLQPQLVGLHRCPGFPNSAVVSDGDVSPFPTAGHFVNVKSLKSFSQDQLRIVFRKKLCDCPWVRGGLKATLVVKGASIIRMVR